MTAFGNPEPEGLRRLSLVDAAFINLERRETPMHVAGLMIYQLPPDAGPDFIKGLVRRFRSPVKLGAPWNQVLAKAPLSRLAPAVTAVSQIDFDYHVRHSALPAPGGERELGELISNLHGVWLDRSRPLWTCHIVEGLERGRFAIYLKIHHALADGVRCMRFVEACHATAPGQAIRAPWDDTHTSKRKSRATVPARRPKFGLSDVAAAVKHTATSMSWSRDHDPERIRPFSAPRSKLNSYVTNARRVATQQLEIDRLKRIAQLAGVSSNDVYLSVIGAALRAHLKAQDGLPDRSLIAAVPFSLRQLGDDANGNQVAFSWATLATNIDEPAVRLNRVHASTLAAKRHIQTMPAPLRPFLTAALAAPATLAGAAGLTRWLPPPMNLVVSNVPGPASTLYLGDASLEALYPVSIPMQGQVLNITGVSYGRHLNVGFTGSRDALPHLQRLALLSRAALDELERAYNN
jgi:diacylglycerol O-acyltransferase